MIVFIDRVSQCFYPSFEGRQADRKGNKERKWICVRKNNNIHFNSKREQEERNSVLFHRFFDDTWSEDIQNRQKNTKQEREQDGYYIQTREGKERRINENQQELESRENEKRSIA